MRISAYGLIEMQLLRSRPRPTTCSTFTRTRKAPPLTIWGPCSTETSRRSAPGGFYYARLEPTFERRRSMRNRDVRDCVLIGRGPRAAVSLRVIAVGLGAPACRVSYGDHQLASCRASTPGAVTRVSSRSPAVPTGSLSTIHEVFQAERNVIMSAANNMASAFQGRSRCDHSSRASVRNSAGWT